MNHDESWFLIEMDLFNELTRDDDVFDDYFFSDEYLRAVDDDEDASPDPHVEWLNRRLNRHRRRPKRQLHTCRPQLWQKWDRRERSHHQAERSLLVQQTGQRDLIDQLDDYYAEQFTDIPSVGMTVGNASYRDNVGEYPLVHRDLEDYEEDWGIIEDARMPDWQYYGFASEVEYEEYLDAYSSFYDDDWHDPSYYDDVVQLETA